MSTVLDTDPEAAGMELAHSMRWFLREEAYLHRLHECCLQLSHDYMRLHKVTHRTQTRFRLPAIVLSSLAGFASFGSSGFGSDDASRYISVAVGVVNIGIAIMQTYESYLKINDIVTQSLATSNALKKLADDIHCETFLPVEDRNESGVTFLRNAFTRFQSIMEQAPTLDDDSEYKGIGYKDLEAAISRDLARRPSVWWPPRPAATASVVAAEGLRLAERAASATTAGAVSHGLPQRTLSRFNTPTKHRFDQAICVRPVRSQTSSGQILMDRLPGKAVSFKVRELGSRASSVGGRAVREEEAAATARMRTALTMTPSMLFGQADGEEEDAVGDEAHVALDMSASPSAEVDGDQDGADDFVEALDEDEQGQDEERGRGH